MMLMENLAEACACGCMGGGRVHLIFPNMLRSLRMKSGVPVKCLPGMGCLKNVIQFFSPAAHFPEPGRTGPWQFFSTCAVIFPIWGLFLIAAQSLPMILDDRIISHPCLER